MTEEIIKPSYKNVSKYEHTCKTCLDRNLLVECECGCHELMFRRDKHGKTRYFLRGHIVRVSNRKPKKQRSPSVKDRFNCQKCRDMSWIIECECKCGGVLNRCNKDGYVKKFIMNHHMNLDEFKIDQDGEKNANWKGGITYSHNYRYLKMPDYFNAEKSGYVAEHIYVYQEYYKVCILPEYEIHHLDPVREGYCNNMVWNLKLMKKSDHLSHHKKIDMSDRKCNLCNGKTRKDKNGYDDWRADINGFLCFNCYLMVRAYKIKFGLE